MNIEKELLKIPFFGKKSGLNNIKSIMEILYDTTDIKQYLDDVKIIHVTGTDGKGSVCKMLSNIYEKSGYNVGLFTSPHIVDIKERIQLNNKNITNEDFEKAYIDIKDIIEKLHSKNIFPTFFEWIFSMAILTFYVKNMDIIILEVGIGGLLDTTNIISKKIASIITNVGIDHQGILGDTIEEIAVQKAGIISKNSITIIGPQKSESENIIKNIAEKYNNKIFMANDFKIKLINSNEKGIDFFQNNKYYIYKGLELEKFPDYQIENISTAITTIEALNDKLKVDFKCAIKCINEFSMPARFEKIKKNIILDGAHNELGIKSLVSQMQIVSQKSKKNINLLIAMKKGKNYKQVTSILNESNLFQKIYITKMKKIDSIDNKELSENFRKVKVVDDYEEIIKHYENSNEILLITGSLYFCSEVRKMF